ncbi:hypothetical protein D3C86_1340980 [compost metagenome]
MPEAPGMDIKLDFLLSPLPGSGTPDHRDTDVTPYTQRIAIMGDFTIVGLTVFRIVNLSVVIGFGTRFFKVTQDL